MSDSWMKFELFKIVNEKIHPYDLIFEFCDEKFRFVFTIRLRYLL